jgi:HflK protein
MQRNTNRNGLFNVVALLAATLLVYGLSRLGNSLVGPVVTVWLGLGFLVATVSGFQMRLEDREEVERLEFEEISQGTADSSLFSTKAADSFPARRSREQFERFFVPGFSLLMFLAQVGGAFALWRWLAKAGPYELTKGTVTMAGFAFVALVLFLLGKYQSGLVRRLTGQRLLRPASAYLLLGAYLAAACAGVLVAVEAGASLRVDLYAARVITLLLALIGAENLVAMVFEIYRPRVKGRSERLLYDSRLVGLLGQPEGLFTTAAHALDYQFGFKVSETWFYRFLEKTLVWLVMVQLLLVWLATCFLTIEPGEQGILERLGRPHAAHPILGPGVHWKLPWPVELVYRYRTEQVQSFEIGYITGKQDHHENTILWTEAHFEEEFHMLVANRDEGASSSTNGFSAEQTVPVSLLVVNIPVQFQITNIMMWATNCAEPSQLLEKTATREVVRYLVNADMLDIMTRGREAAGHALRQRIQDRANELRLGVRLVFVGVQGIHPPVKVASAYEAVIAAIQEKETKIQQAEGYRASTLPQARAEAVRLVNAAQVYREAKVVEAFAQADQFTNRLAAFRASPQVYGWRSYLGTLAQSSTGARKYVIATTNTQDVILLNLEDKLRPDLLDVPLPADSTK